MEEHTKKYLKIRTGKDFDVEDIRQTMETIFNRTEQNKFDNSRERNLEAYVRNYQNIVVNNLPLHYNQDTKEGDKYSLKSVSDHSEVYIVENFLTMDECDQLIALLERSNKKHIGFTSSLTAKHITSFRELSSNNAKKSIDMDLNDFYIYRELDDDGKLFSAFNDKIKSRLMLIVKNFMVYYVWPGDVRDYGISDITLRKYIPGTCGYSYHNDYLYNIRDGKGQRFMSFVLYLNNVHQGGETKFLHYNVSVQPIKGRLLIFPPTHLHIHTGMPPISGPKYIITCFLHKNT